NGDTETYTPISSAASGAVDTRTFSGQATGETSQIDFDAIADSIGTSTDFTLTPAQLATTTGTQFVGQLEILSGGDYDFELTSDDGTRLFIDGILAINNEGSKSPTLRSSTVNLDAGFHEIRVDYVNNSGGGALILEYAGNDQATIGAIPSARLYRAENAGSVSTTVAPNTTVELGDNIILSNGASATIALNGTDFSNAGLEALTVGTSSTLNITGTANRDLRFQSTTFGGTSTYTFNTAPDLSLGEASGTASGTTIVKQGTGRLILDNTSSTTPNDFTGTTFDVQAGSLFVIGNGNVGATNPLGTSSVQLNGGTLALDTAVGDVSFDNIITLAGTGGTIKTVSGPRTFTLTDTTAINIGSGQTLTLETTNGSNISEGSSLVLTQALTGSGNLTITDSTAGNGPLEGTAALTSDSASFSGQITISSGTLEGRSGTTNSKVFGTGVIDLAGGTLSLQGANAGGSLNYTPGNNVSVTANSGFVVGAASGGGSSSDFALGSLTTVGGRTVTMDSTDDYSLIFASTVLGGNTTFNVNSGTLNTGDITGTAANLTKNGVGTLVLGGSSNLTGTTAINAGILEASVISDSGANSLGTSSVTLNGGTLRYTGSASASTTRSISANNGNGGSIDVSDAGATFEINSGFAGNQNSEVLKLGAGTR
ncbi:MAG: PA14 domain-containing protein, partial [Verrucomicrobiota bacterium]